MTYSEYKEAKQTQDQIVKELDKKVNEFETNEIGVVTDEVRTSEEYKVVKNTFDREFKKLQVINTFGAKNFKKEMRAERANKYLTV